MLYQLSYARDRSLLTHELVAVSQYLHLRIERKVKRVGHLGVRYGNLGIRGADGVPLVVIEGETQGERGAGVQRLIDGHARNAATGAQRLERELVDLER